MKKLKFNYKNGIWGYELNNLIKRKECKKRCCKLLKLASIVGAAIIASTLFHKRGCCKK